MAVSQENVKEILNKLLHKGREVSEMLLVKAEEAKKFSSLKLKKKKIEFQMSKKFTEVGRVIYEKMINEPNSDFRSDDRVKLLVENLKNLDKDLTYNKELLEKEKLKLKGDSP